MNMSVKQKKWKEQKDLYFFLRANPFLSLVCTARYCYGISVCLSVRHIVVLGINTCI